MSKTTVKIKTKKIFAMVIACVTATVLFSSCALFGKVTAFGLYSKAVSKVARAGGYNADCVITVSLSLMGEELSQDTVMNFKQNQTGVQVTTDVDGETVTSTYIGDKVYVEYEDSLIFYTVVDDSAEDSFGSANIPELASDVFDDVEVVTNDDGTKRTVVTLGSESASGVLGSLLDQLGDLSFSDITLTMVFDSSNDLSSMTFECSATADVYGYELTGDVRAEYTFIDFGTAPEFSLGHDESEFEDGGEFAG